MGSVTRAEVFFFFLFWSQGDVLTSRVRSVDGLKTRSLLCFSCVAKKKCFAPAALYKPFGQQAAGVRSLAQFQALQDGEKELASLRELGLTDAEIELWRNRDARDGAAKVRVKTGGVRAPGRNMQTSRQHFSSSLPALRYSEKAA